MFTIHTRRCTDNLTDSVHCICVHITVIRHGLVSAWRPAATTLFHGQERDLATEPFLWPAQLYGTVYLQHFVKLTACIRLGASSKYICLLCFSEWLKLVSLLSTSAYSALEVLYIALYKSTYLLTYLKVISRNAGDMSKNAECLSCSRRNNTFPHNVYYVPVLMGNPAKFHSSSTNGLCVEMGDTAKIWVMRRSAPLGRGGVHFWQESLANAKVSARQQNVYEGP